MHDRKPYLELKQISKRYGGVAALTGVDFSVYPGEIQAVLGENGAGKSTLIKIASGVTDPTEGEVLVEGKPVRFRSPTEAMRAGVVCVFQELSLLPEMTVADNLSIIDPPKWLGLIDAKGQRERARALLKRVGCEDVHPLELVRDLPLSRRQMVEIAKALGRNPRILILDEATSALTADDVERVYGIIRDLKASGVGILYVSHRMREIEALADTATVFRNGRKIETFTKGARSVDAIIEMMIGREVTHQYPEKPDPSTDKPVALAAANLAWGREIQDISFNLRKGEIVGLGGLDGQGQRELLLALFGVLRGVSGTVAVDGKPLLLDGPRRAMHAPLPMALIPEDRKTEGLMLPMSVRDNMTLAALPHLAGRFGVDRDKENAAVQSMVDRLRVKTPDMLAPVSALSGGNQQKVVLAKWLMTEPGIILLNDPTRGIDVGTKQEIYRLMRELANQGAAILFYSTDYAELIGCCDRVLVIYGGRIRRELAGETLNERSLLQSALNVDATEQAA
ncbi:monosaccharide ABC transporter ATP-binding protein, CUT2 family (TC 3.A.1.2.-) [Kaistia soli DSM 19436]|uniref:Monosaccharide ABC transporter ATP-binding protein, CUT2 family (TC 3.A.1.2.-) n=1 Tax=Kaistia soli DSM 19436 TaxID=1122133 RepID=A0A1M5IA06_9HYPH|nr:sugar ABC transporter ATP-binding protein [Kaistia soli]SHG25136.1 monosaccharide ABC transporter ATP-binding protein, CUT2 family (TC 3.A.1.2.-) [Kaistia soli DSM 19436]